MHKILNKEIMIIHFRIEFLMLKVDFKKDL